MADDVFGIVGTTQAGNFHVEQVVAEGGFGVVYRALHGGFRAPVALKCLKVSEARTARERDLFLEKFREEAQLLFRLSASIPEVVRPLHVDVLHLKNGQFVPFLALEWLEGESLDKVIDRRQMQGEQPIPLQKLVKMMRPIAHAIARAHRFPSPGGTMSIIHRDLKPENIFITMQEGEERLRILDFGIAQAKSLAEQAVGRVTGSDKLNAFSPAYGAPEQWVPKRFGQTGTWTDVWGLALTMVETLVGRQVIEGETQAMMGTVLDTTRRPTPRAEGVNVSAEVDAVFERALAVNPKDRTKDVETFWSELEAAMGLAPSLGPRAAQDDPYGAPPSARLPPPPKPRPSGQMWLEAPTESAALEIDFDAAPASMRSLLRDGPASAHPGPSTAPPEPSGLEVDLPEGPPPSARPRLGSVPSDQGPGSVRPRGLGGASGGPSSVRQRELLREIGAPEHGMDADLGASPRVPPRAGSMPPRAGSMPPPASVRPAASSALGPRPPLRAPVEPPPAPSLLHKLAVPLLCILFAVAITLTDLIMKSSGPGLMFGSIRSFWVAGVLLLAGVGLFFWRLLGDSGDG